VSSALTFKGVLDNKVAIVTGAGRGIGKAIAEGFAREGATVCCVSRTATEVDATARGIAAAGGQAFSIAADVTDPDAVDRLLASTVERAGGLDILVANHGVSLDWKTVEQSNVDDWLRTFDVNVHGVYHCARLAIPHLKRRGGGNMIVIGSGQGHRGSPGVAAYACSKAAVWMLVRVLADELRADGISVNELLPGGVRTTLDRYRPRVDAPPAPRPPGDPIREPEEIVPLAIFLAAQPPSGPTGQSFSLRRQTL
jgi:3-oxoacyl-[acyl-carrier protein] reductase